MPRIKLDRDKATGRWLPDNLGGIRHGGYLKTMRGLPLSVRRQVTAVREGLVRDIAGKEADLTAAQAILIDKTVNLYQITLCLEAHVRREGPFRGKKLDPILGQNYITYVNMIRLTLRELGISRKALEVEATLADIAREYEQKGLEAHESGQEGPGQDQGEGQGGEG
jgi:hypothetical protein